MQPDFFRGMQQEESVLKRNTVSHSDRGLGDIKGNLLGSAVAYQRVITIFDNKSEEIRIRYLITKSILPVLYNFVYFYIFKYL